MTNLPAIIPSLRKWASFGNYLPLSDACRLVIAPSHIEELAETTETLQEVFYSEIKRPLTVIIGSEPGRGDILLKLDRNSQEIAEQGYILEIDEHVKVQARTATGIFYGGQTLLQMLHQDPAHTQLLRGLAYDYPSFLQRGIMLDAGRKYWGMDYLYNIMRQMARLKLNTLHLHLSDWNAFRLQSDLHPGLSASQAYSKSDITSLQAYARQCHITIIPEIDLPAHATVISRYDPSLAFSCEVMSKAR
ncbi:MAG: family 20 glycosylhydrolase, partial [Chloroflexi bacterium]|nr:family 20 glycosylhydrolase [Chloroflexota bacterium]